MKNDYEKNLNRLLSYYPNIYIKKKEIPNNVKKYVLYNDTYYSINGESVVNSFTEYDHTTIKVNQLRIDISLEELDNINNQLKRDEKLKEAMKIINE